MPRLQGLIFDLDGTLLDSAPDLRQAVNLTLTAYDRHEVGIEAIKNMVGDGMIPLLQRAFAAGGKPLAGRKETDKAAELFLSTYQSLPPDRSQIYPHVIDQLERFKKSGVKMGLCTNKQESATLTLMNDLDMTKYFGFIAGYDTFSVHKPHPGHVLGVMDKIGVLAGECAMVGDSLNDISAAHRAGIACIGVTHGYGNDISDLGADHLIYDFRELPSALRTLGFEFA